MGISRIIEEAEEDRSLSDWSFLLSSWKKVRKPSQGEDPQKQVWASNI